MIDLDSSPARYRGTIEVYLNEVPSVWFDAPAEWRWRCKSRNGQILGHGEGYRRKAGALNAIDAMFGAKLTDRTSVNLTALGIKPHTRVVPWRLVIVDRHGNTTTGAVY